MQHPVPAGSRRAIRRAVSISCEVVCPRIDHPVRHMATDLSPEGIWLQTADPARAGEQVVVCFEPRGGWSGGELMVFAEVARVTTTRRRQAEPGIGMGLEFLDLSDAERSMLVAWLREQRAPVPRRQRPVRRWSVPAPEMSLAFDEVMGTTAVQPVMAPPLVDEPPRSHRPLAVCWR